ncbi:MAG TPA: bifunctional phosphopantothenoylcysteine decarboxylase/phosphopantothenate--cysteine ligase CoaBC [Actinomycetota bacterium]|nr:bifunctional phosphopantothenoylcysteine decarboxylase/phosphopantothenate--cysteine ligase CoaBC [Actinomycetota bacterium]
MSETPSRSDLGALRGARVVLGVTGGIASYKAVEIARLLGKAGARVQALMTDAAQRFVTPATFAAITHRAVPTDVFDSPELVVHVRLARDTDVIVVAPATANIIAKMAHGIADDLLTNVLLNATVPLVVAPAMHTEMWEHAATQENMRTLRERGAIIVDPEEGELAGGDEGVGRLADPTIVVEAVAEALARGHDLAGVRVIVTAGGTQEPIDPVRYISNRSSGKMGFALAREAANRGAAVTLISAPAALPVPDRVEIVRVRTAEEMRDAVVARFAETDVVVKAAAVADFKAKAVAEGKIKKANAPSAIELEPTVDIAAELGAMKKRQILVGFAAETDDHIAAARKKLQNKNLDLIVLNDVRATDAGFEVDTNRVVILGADGTEEEVPLQLKTGIAQVIWDRVSNALKARDER